jgi:hypothetical protein
MPMCKIFLVQPDNSVVSTEWARHPNDELPKVFDFASVSYAFAAADHVERDITSAFYAHPNADIDRVRTMAEDFFA